MSSALALCRRVGVAAVLSFWFAFAGLAADVHSPNVSGISVSIDVVRTDAATGDSASYAVTYTREAIVVAIQKGSLSVR
jgi:hypothetical protein